MSGRTERQTESESGMNEWTDGWMDGEEDNDGQTDEVDEWKRSERWNSTVRDPLLIH